MDFLCCRYGSAKNAGKEIDWDDVKGAELFVGV